ncbi:MAG: hypothetical protein H7329_00490 [Opitutaceae bacterium]|nr:hypothetical protein [Cytophagales bacterium]
MIIYNKTWLYNLEIRNKAKIWRFNGLVSEVEQTRILENKPVGFYMPGFWMALGLFFFTTILLSATGGFISFVVLTTGIDEEFAFHVVNFIFSIGCFYFAEQYKKEKHYYNAGTDNALIWAGTGSLIGNAFWILFETGFHDQSVWIVGFILATFICFLVTLRYADVFVALAASICGLITLFFLFGNMGNLGIAFIPFAGFSYSLSTYLILKHKVSKEHKLFYHDCIAITEAASLICAYISINYFIVRELSIEMFDLNLSEGQDIPYGFIFNFLTVAIPPAYIYFALKNKNRIMLRIGLLLVGASIFTIRYYHSILRAELAMLLGGSLLIGLSYFLLKWLHSPKFGFSVKEDLENQSYKIAESLIVAETFSQQPDVQRNIELGEGNFGGAGANESY